MEERIYTIPLLRAKMAPRTKRAKKAIKIIREFLAKHTKADTIKIDKSINEAIWARGIRKVPSKIRVKAVKVEEEVWAYTPESEIRREEEKVEEVEEKKEIETKEEESEEEPKEENKEKEGMEEVEKPVEEN